jgi:hypothetical protein
MPIQNCTWTGRIPCLQVEGDRTLFHERKQKDKFSCLNWEVIHTLHYQIAEGHTFASNKICNIQVQSPAPKLCWKYYVMSNYSQWASAKVKWQYTMDIPHKSTPCISTHFTHTRLFKLSPFWSQCNRSSWNELNLNIKFSSLVHSTRWPDSAETLYQHPSGPWHSLSWFSDRKASSGVQYHPEYVPAYMCPPACKRFCWHSLHYLVHLLHSVLYW